MIHLFIENQLQSVFLPTTKVLNLYLTGAKLLVCYYISVLRNDLIANVYLDTFFITTITIYSPPFIQYLKKYCLCVTIYLFFVQATIQTYRYFASYRQTSEIVNNKPFHTIFSLVTATKKLLILQF